MQRHIRKKAFTLVEMMVCTIIISVMVVCLMQFSSELSLSYKKNQERSNTIMAEYSDIMQIRSSDNSNVALKNQDYYTLIESSGQWQLWKYDGVYFHLSKFYGGGDSEN